jgi:hypothetical protein
MTTRRKRQSDAYIDDDPLDENNCLKDGRTYRVPLMLADSGAFIVDSHAVPRSRFTPSSTSGRFAYKRGYLSDANSGLIVDARPRERISDPTRERGESGQIAWPQSTANIVPMFNNAIGAKCVCESGEAGTLQPHPTIASSLYCVPSRRDAATAMDGESAYRRMVDEAPFEYQKYRAAPLHDCGCHQRDQEGMVPGYINPQLAWPTGQRAGDQCTTDDRRPGHLEARGDGYVCVPDRNGKSDADIVAPMGTYAVGGPWPEGCSCDLGNGQYGILVKEGDRLVCRERQAGNGDASVDHQAIRDRAYWDSVKSAATDYLRWK